MCCKPLIYFTIVNHNRIDRILFSTNGERPESDKTSDGDMDGDMCLVRF